MTLILNTKPYKLHLIQVYMPTTDGDDQEIEELYNIIENTMVTLKLKGIVIVLGDFNSNVGRPSTRHSGSLWPGRPKRTRQQMNTICY